MLRQTGHEPVRSSALTASPRRHPRVDAARGLRLRAAGVGAAAAGAHRGGSLLLRTRRHGRTARAATAPHRTVFQRRDRERRTARLRAARPIRARPRARGLRRAPRACALRRADGLPDLAASSAACTSRRGHAVLKPGFARRQPARGCRARSFVRHCVRAPGCAPGREPAPVAWRRPPATACAAPCARPARRPTHLSPRSRRSS